MSGGGGPPSSPMVSTIGPRSGLAGAVGDPVEGTSPSHTTAHRPLRPASLESASSLGTDIRTHATRRSRHAQGQRARCVFSYLQPRIGAPVRARRTLALGDVRPPTPRISDRCPRSRSSGPRPTAAGLRVPGPHPLARDRSQPRGPQLSRPAHSCVIAARSSRLAGTAVGPPERGPALARRGFAPPAPARDAGGPGGMAIAVVRRDAPSIDL